MTRRAARQELLDLEVQNLITNFYNGELDERTVRLEISGILHVSGVASEVASYTSQTDSGRRTDIAESLEALLIDKVIGAAENGYCLERGHGSSFIGWARETARVAARSLLRDSRRRMVREGALMAPRTMATIHEGARVCFSGSGTSADEISDRLLDAVSDYSSSANHARGPVRVDLAVTKLVASFGVNVAVRPAEMADRDALAALLGRNKNLAYDALVAWTNVAYGSNVELIDAAIDPRLLMLWDTQTRESALALLDLPEGIAHVLALAAVQQRARPGLPSVRKFREAVRTGYGPPVAAWRQLAANLANAYIDTEFEAYTRYQVLDEESRAAAVKGHAVSRERFDQLALKAIDYPGSRLGSTIAEVRSTLADVTEDLGLVAAGVAARQDRRPATTTAATAL